MVAILEPKSVTEAQQYVEANGNKLEQSVRANITVPELTRRQAFLTSGKITIFLISLLVLGIVLALTAGILLPRIGTPAIALMILGVILVFFVGFGFVYRSNSLASYRKQVKFDQRSAYADFFRENFDNLSVTGWTSAEQVKLIRAMRPGPVPADAAIVAMNYGMSGEIDGLNYQSVWIRWRWTRTVSNGKTTTTQTYYYHAIAGIFTGLNERFLNFSMKMSYPSSSLGFKLGKRTELEDKAFEKKTSIWSDDDIALRRVLTPRTQEWIVAEITRKSVPYTELVLLKNTLVVFRHDAHECFNVNFRVSRNPNVLIDSFTKDLKDDIAHAISFFSHMHIFQTLSRG